MNRRRLFTTCLVLVLLPAYLMVGMGCKKIVEKVDLSGNWRFSARLNTGEAVNRNFQFIGGTDFGNVIYQGQARGTWMAVEGNECIVVLTYEEGNALHFEQYTGMHQDNREISGDAVIEQGDHEGYGPFTAVKVD